MPGEHITKGCLWKCKKKKERQRDKVFTNVHNRRCHLSPHICQELKLARLKPCIKFPPAAFATRVSYLSQDSSRIQILLFVAFQNPPANAGETGLIPGSERSLEKEKASHSSLLAWEIPWAIVHWVTKSQIWLSDQTKITNEPVILVSGTTRWLKSLIIAHSNALLSLYPYIKNSNCSY